MGLTKDRNGTWLVRKMVPKRLREAVARVLNNDKQSQMWLQRSTGTKHKDEATRLAPAIMQEFSTVLQQAEGLLAERPLRTTLTQAEIDQLAEWHYANVLAADEAFTSEGAAEDEALVRSTADQFTEAGIEYDMPYALDAKPPAYGLSNRQLIKRGGRYCGEPVETPAVANQEPTLGTNTAQATPRVDGRPTLQAAFEGWQKERRRPASTVTEYQRALRLFTGLHGSVSVADIRKQHALQFRQALQETPSGKTKELSKERAR
jgi:hypothetical protein